MWHIDFQEFLLVLAVTWIGAGLLYYRWLMRHSWHLPAALEACLPLRGRWLQHLLAPAAALLLGMLSLLLLVVLIAFSPWALGGAALALTGWKCKSPRL